MPYNKEKYNTDPEYRRKILDKKREYKKKIQEKKEKYFCESCNIEMCKNSKYCHNKSVLHKILSGDNDIPEIYQNDKLQILYDPDYKNYIIPVGLTEPDPNIKKWRVISRDRKLYIPTEEEYNKRFIYAYPEFLRK